MLYSRIDASPAMTEGPAITPASVGAPLDVGDPSAQPSEVVWLESVPGLGSLREEWLRLACALPAASYFQTPDWILGWWRTLGGQPASMVAFWRDESGEVDAVAALSRLHQPLHRRVPLRVPVWINTGSGVGAADHCGWLARPDRQGAVWNWVRQQTRGDTLLLQNVDPSLGSLPAPARSVWDTPCPRAVLDDADDKAYSANFRQQLRARERKLRAMGVTLRWIDPPGVDDGVLDSLFSLHQDRWRSKDARSSFTPEQLAFHRMLAAASAPGRGPAAVVAEHEGSSVGVLYGFWFRDAFAYYQMGWDPAWARHSLGTVLLREGIRMTRARGGRVFDFLRGSEPFKYRFAAADRVDTTWLVGSGWPGPILRSGFAGRRLIRSVRRALDERGRARGAA